MAITLGTFRLLDEDGPDTITRGVSLAGRVVQRSDGTQSMTVTGVTPQDMTVAGVINDTPANLAALDGLAASISSTPVPFSLTGQNVLVRDVTYRQGNGEIDYTLTLFIPTAFTAGTGSSDTGQPAANAQVDRLTALPGGSPGLQAAQAQVRVARSPTPVRH